MYRVQRWGVAAIFAVHGAAQGTFASRIPAIAENLHLSAGWLGLALFMPAAGSLSAMPFAGRLIHRIGGRRSTQLLLAAWCLALILPALAPDLLALCACLAVFGACAGTADIAMNAQGSALEQRMGKSIMSSLHGSWSIGGFIGAGVGVVAARWDVPVLAHFAAVSTVLLIVGQIACRTLPQRADEHAGPDGAADEPEPPRFSLPRGPVLVIGLVAFCAVFAEVAGSDWCGVYLRDVLDSGHAIAAFGVAVFAVGMAAARLAGDRLIRWLGPVRSVRACASVGAVGAALIVVGANSTLTIIGFAMMGVGVAVVVPLAFAAAGRFGAEGGHAGRGSAIAGVATVAYGAGLAAPGVIGGVASLTSLRGSFILITILVAIVAIAASVLRNRNTESVNSVETPTASATTTF
jgi:MFS family permease